MLFFNTYRSGNFGGSLISNNKRSQLRESCSFFRLTLTRKVVLAFVYVNIFFLITKILQ